MSVNIEQLKQVHQARPFRPFSLHLADGRTIQVRHPEFLAQSPGGRIVNVATGDHSFEWIDLLLVTSIEIGNGEMQNASGDT